MVNNNQNSDVKPSAEETQAMAANMLGNATAQKSAIADTFIQQRDETLKAVAESKQSTLGQAEALIASASESANSTAEQAESRAAMEAAMKAANIPPPTDEELAILQAVMAQKNSQEAQAPNATEPPEPSPQFRQPPSAHTNKAPQVPPPSYPPSNTQANYANQLVMQEIALVIRDIITREVAAQVANISRIHNK